MLGPSSCAAVLAAPPMPAPACTHLAAQSSVAEPSLVCVHESAQHRRHVVRRLAHASIRPRHRRRRFLGCAPPQLPPGQLDFSISRADSCSSGACPCPSLRPGLAYRHVQRAAEVGPPAAFRRRHEQRRCPRRQGHLQRRAALGLVGPTHAGSVQHSASSGDPRCVQPGSRCRAVSHGLPLVSISAM